MLYDQPFSRCMFVKNRKSTEWTQADLPSTLCCQKYPEYTEYFLPIPKLSSVFLNNQRWQKLERHRMTSEWHWTRNCQKYPVYTKEAHFSYVLLYDQPFSRCKVVKKIENSPNDLRVTCLYVACIHWLLTHESQVYSISLSKIGNAPKDLRVTLNT